MIEKHIVYKPDWRIYRFQFILSLILIPLIIGIPLFALYYFKMQRISYRISDTKIEIRDTDIISIHFKEIREFELRVLPKFLKMNTGDIIIKTSSTTYVLRSLTSYENLYDALSYQLELIKNINDDKILRERIQIKADPGTLERLNDLLGMWQQGIISDTDYWAERRKFEK